MAFVTAVRLPHQANCAEFTCHALKLPRGQESLQFTQLKMEYNMGWLVQARLQLNLLRVSDHSTPIGRWSHIVFRQAEAPPGALFKKFKKCVQEGT